MLEVVSTAPDPTDYLNALIEYAGSRPVSKFLSECLWDVIRRRLPEGADEEAASADQQLAHMLRHALRFAHRGAEVPRCLGYTSNVCAKWGRRRLWTRSRGRAPRR